MHVNYVNLIPSIAWENNLVQLCPLSAASLLLTSMKPRVASCDSTQWRRTVQRKCESRGNGINSVPFSSSCFTVKSRTCSYSFVGCTSSFFLSASSPPLLSFSDAWWLHSRLPWSLHLHKSGYATPHTHTHTDTHMQIPATCAQHLFLHKNFFAPPPPCCRSVPKMATRNKWRLHSVFSAAEIICKFPLQTPDLARSAQGPSAL